MPYSVAIDGPSGAGKSTIAKRLAADLGFHYVDTGALYRTVGLAMTEAGVDPADEVAVAKALESMTVFVTYEEGRQIVLLNGTDRGADIRTAAVAAAASRFSAIPAVRAFLLDTQRELATRFSVIMDGRDIGTTVLPAADLKIFLTASPEARARRRMADLAAQGEPADFDTVLAAMQKRDYDDSHRAISPLMQAADAVAVDTSGNTLEMSVTQLRQIVTDRLGL